MGDRMDFQLNEISLIISNKKLDYELPYLWIRDNCPCNECRIEETLEKKFKLKYVPEDLNPQSVAIDENDIHIG